MSKGENMPVIPQPGEPGYNFETFMAHLVNVGLREARTVGFGLPLVNELQSLFPDVDRTILGSAAGIVGQGVRAAVQFRSLPPDATPDIESLPTLPSPFFQTGEPSRVFTASDVQWHTGVARPASIWRVDFEGGETLTQQDIIDAIANRLIEEKEVSDPREAQDIAIDMVTLFFMGKRF